MYIKVFKFISHQYNANYNHNAINQNNRMPKIKKVKILILLRTRSSLIPLLFVSLYTFKQPIWKSI